MTQEVAVDTPGETRPGLGGIPKGVWALGFVSLLMDTSSEMIHSLLPVFLTSVLGVSALSVGISIHPKRSAIQGFRET